MLYIAASPSSVKPYVLLFCVKLSIKITRLARCCWNVPSTACLLYLDVQYPKHSIKCNHLNSNTEDSHWGKKFKGPISSCSSHPFAHKKFGIWMDYLPVLHNLSLSSRKCNFCTCKCIYNKYLYLSHSTFFSSPRSCRDFIAIHWHKRPGHASALLINCQLKSMELFKKSHYRVLPIRGLIHFPLNDCNIFTDF